MANQTSDITGFAAAVLLAFCLRMDTTVSRRRCTFKNVPETHAITCALLFLDY